MTSLSIVDLSPMSNRDDGDCALIFIEDHSPIADTKSRSVTPPETLHIAVSGPCKLHQATIDATAYVDSD
jgi:hypothetical protein